MRGALAIINHDWLEIFDWPDFGLRGKDLTDPDTRVADAVAAEVWRLAEAITSDDVLGLHLAEAVPAGTLDLLEYAFRASPTLGSGLEQVARYGRVVSDRAASRLRLVGDVVEISWDVALQVNEHHRYR